MEITISKLFEHDGNKENMSIPSSFTKEANVPILEKAKKTLPIVKKRFRRPLQDITHLFINSQPLVQLSSAAFLTESFLSPVAAAATNCRKRKADGDDEIDSTKKNASKILRKEFR